MTASMLPSIDNELGHSRSQASAYFSGPAGLRPSSLSILGQHGRVMISERFLRAAKVFEVRPIVVFLFIGADISSR